MGKILAICVSEKKGIGKTKVNQINLVENFGLEGDAHGGNWHRQVSLLSFEKIEEFKNKGGKVNDGDFGENLIVEGFDLSKLPIGTKLKINNALLEVTQIGKKCHAHCNIFHTVGDCIMPREGIFAKVLQGDFIKIGDSVNIVADELK
ncbi:MOSC domain-containing protein [Cetobacterium sp. SF1]|uniref:MOSC domain-containing protein n=1 Tax=unclassified Cetobacterium TaxID=2630983 RepID=UPI003CF4205B